MLSAIVLAADGRAPQASPEAVVRTLATLVPAAIEGLVRDVTLAGVAGADLAEIAEQAGCAFTEMTDQDRLLAQALTLARGPVVFVLRAGFAPEAGYIDEIGDVLARDAAGARGALMRERTHGFWAGIVPALAAPVGVIASVQRMREAGRADLRGLVAALRPAVMLRARGRRV